MIRPVLTEVALFLLPFVLYALYLSVTRAGVAARSSWPPKTLLTLAIVSMLLIIGSFFFLARSSAPAGSTYEPARVDESGRMIPGRMR